MDDIEDDARKLLDRMKLIPPREPGEKLRPSDEVRILDLSAQGWTQERIAADVGCHQSTVSRTLAIHVSTLEPAKQKVNALAYKAVSVLGELMESEDPAARYKASSKVCDMNGLTESKDLNVQVAVVLGVTARTASRSRCRVGLVPRHDAPSSAGIAVVALA